MIVGNLLNFPYPLEDVVLTSGYYDPLHVGHVRYLMEAATLAKVHVAVVNGDRALRLKRLEGRIFMPAGERAYIVDSIKGVTYTLVWDNPTVEGVLAELRPKVFAKGGDRDSPDNIPEWKICKKLGIIVAVGVGGDKVRSSSGLLKGM